MKVIRIAVMAIAASIASLAYAGVAAPVPVVVTLNPSGSGSAQGDMLTARYSRNDVEYIGCGITFIDFLNGTTISTGFCQASDAEGEVAVCFTQNADLLSAMNAATAYSFIRFSFNDTGQCTQIRFSTQSWYLPNKVHKPSR